MPTLTAVQGRPGNFVLQARAWMAMARRAEFRKRLLAPVQQAVDVVHLNLETLWPLARWLRKRCGARFVFHVRKTPRPNAFTRRQARMVERCATTWFSSPRTSSSASSNCVAARCGVMWYTTSQNLRRRRARRCRASGRWASARRVSLKLLLRPRHRSSGRHCGSLRGIGSTDVLFVVAGDMALSSSLPGALGRVGARGGSLADYATTRA